MNDQDKTQLESHIRSRIDAVKADIESYTQLAKPVSPDNAIGRITRMEAINSKSINEAALNKSKQTLSNLEEALKLINDPDFGLCAECEEPIPFKRLMAMPESAFCVKCAGKLYD